MPGYLETLEIVEENSTGNIDYLKGNVFQKIEATINVRFETWTNCLTDEEIVFDDPRQRTDDWLWDNTVTNRFNGFAVGDEITVSGATTGANDGTYLVSEKPNDSLIRCTDTVGGAITFTTNLAEATATIFLSETPLGFVFDFGLIENQEGTNFNSKVDGSLMRYEIDAGAGSTNLPSSATSMDAVGKKDWQTYLGSAGVTIERTSSGSEEDNGTYKFEIVHTFFIHPFYLPNQILDILNITTNTVRSPKQPPIYFAFQDCLKYVFRARAHRTLQDPNVYQELVVDHKDGNTGWFDEEYNGGTPEYTKYSIEYSSATGSLTRDDTVTVTCVIDDSVAGASPEYACVNFIMLPEDLTDIQFRDDYLYQNYLWDRAYQQAGAGAIDGETKAISSGWTVLEDVELAQNTPSAGFATVTFDVNFGTDAKAVIDRLSNKNFLIAVYCVENLATAQRANYTTILFDVNQIKVEIPDSTVTTTNEILFHDQNDNSTVSNNHEIKVEDEIVVDSLIELDRSSLDAQIDNIACQIIATDGTDEVVLEEKIFDLSQAPIIGDVRFINETSTSPFNVSSSEIRKEYKCYRSPSQDSGGAYAYRTQFPFLFRWEYWEQLITSTPPADFLDTSLNFNGYNQDWIRIGALSGWDIKFRTSTNVDVTGTTSTIVTDETLTEKDYGANASEWDNPEIRSYDGATQISYSSSPYIMTNKRTKIEVDFEYVGSDPIDETDVYMVFRLYPKENGTHIANDSFSSVWNREGLGAWTSDDGSTAGNGLITITENLGIFTGTAYIDHNDLPAGVTDFTLSASINRDTATSRPDWGEVYTEDVKALKVIDFDPPSISTPDNPFKVCCYPLRVFGDLSDTDSYKNDFTGFLKAFPLQYSVTMKLEKYDETAGTWSSVGTLSNQVSRTKDNLTYYGHKVEWRNYLSSNGAGKYRFKWETGSGSLYSNEYCLEAYSQRRADRTVRIEYTWDSVIGDENQTEIRDFAGMEWPNQIRLFESIFYGRRGTFEKEQVRLQSGEEKTIKKSFREAYSLELRQASMEMHKELMYGVLMADEILISDYNSENADSFVDVSVEINSGYEPNYQGSRPYPSVEFELIDKYDNRRKLYS